ncbi:MAG: gamma-butyrobetaine hydroxylase-like domain-containing protein [Rhizobiaceae bacterium]
MQPTKLTVKKDRKSLEIAFGNDVVYELSAEILRVLSPSAEVQGHSPAQRKTVGGKRDVGIMQMEPVGNYAVRITFDDMHNTGIFSWSYFLDLGQNREQKWADYLAELQEKGLSREPEVRKG